MTDYRVVVTETIEHICVAQIDEEAVVAWLNESETGEAVEGAATAPARVPLTAADITSENIVEWLQSTRESPYGALLNERYGVDHQQDFALKSASRFR